MSVTDSQNFISLFLSFNLMQFGVFPLNYIQFFKEREKSLIFQCMIACRFQKLDNTLILIQWNMEKLGSFYASNPCRLCMDTNPLIIIAAFDFQVTHRQRCSSWAARRRRCVVEVLQWSCGICPIGLSRPRSRKSCAQNLSWQFYKGKAFLLSQCFFNLSLDKIKQHKNH